MLWLGAAAAVAMSLGVLTRLATATAFGVVTYNLFLSTTHFHNNRAYLLIVLAALAVTPGRGRILDVDGPGWPLWLLRFEASVVYGASGFSKLLDDDWFSGTVSWGRLVRVRDRLVADTPLPDWAISLLTDRSFHTVAAKVIVLTEIFIAVGLWWPRTRYAAVWLAVCFHLAIEVSASVQVFSWLSIAALVIWAAPSTRDRLVVRDPTNPGHARLAGAIRRLDWLGRFRVESGPPGSALRAVDRDGTELRGRDAAALVASRLPLTAWFALPVLGVSRLMTRRESLPSDGALLPISGKTFTDSGSGACHDRPSA
jgi:hypothetical protein